MLLNFYNNFLGEAPKWYKNLIIIFLASNPLIYIFLSNIISEAGFIMGWIILAQFILTLAMALNCYPLQPGGLIAIQSVLMGLTNTKNIYHEVELNLKVILQLKETIRHGLKINYHFGKENIPFPRLLGNG